MICPFTPKSTPGHGSTFVCSKDCALWVRSEKMCSFRLLADEIAAQRELARRVAAEHAQLSGGGL